MPRSGIFNLFHADVEAANKSFFGEPTAPGVMMDAVLICLVHNLKPYFPEDAILGMIGAEEIRYMKPMKFNVVYDSIGIVVSLKNQIPTNLLLKYSGKSNVKMAWQFSIALTSCWLKVSATNLKRSRSGLPM